MKSGDWRGIVTSIKAATASEDGIADVRVTPIERPPQFKRIYNPENIKGQRGRCKRVVLEYCVKVGMLVWQIINYWEENECNEGGP